MIGVQMIYNDFNYGTGFREPTMISNLTSNGIQLQNSAIILNNDGSRVSKTNTTNAIYLITPSTSEIGNSSEQQWFVSSMLNRPIALSAIQISNLFTGVFYKFLMFSLH